MSLLTEEAMEELTKCKQAQKQASVLDTNGIYYIRRLDGSIVTTWHHVNHPHALLNQDVDNGIDLSKVS